MTSAILVCIRGLLGSCLLYTSSMPLRAEGERKGRAFLGGVLSGVVEPIGAVLTLLAAQLVIPALPYLLSFAAGAMLYAQTGTGGISTCIWQELSPAYMYISTDKK